MVCHTFFKFNKARAFQDEKWSQVLAMKTPIALLILLVDVRVTLLFIVNAACSRNCPVTPAQVLGVLHFELIVHVPDWDFTSALDLLLFSFLILSMFIPCFFSKCLDIDDVEPVEYLICNMHIVHTSCYCFRFNVFSA